MQMFEYDDIAIYGDAFMDFEKDGNQIEQIEVDISKINILVTHGTLDGAMHKYNDIKNRVYFFKRAH